MLLCVGQRRFARFLVLWGIALNPGVAKKAHVGVLLLQIREHLQGREKDLEHGDYALWNELDRKQRGEQRKDALSHAAFG